MIPLNDKKIQIKPMQNEYPLNINGTEFCNRIGIAYNRAILNDLRELNLVKFFRIGTKYMYPAKDVEKVNELLLTGKISIKTNRGYYITLNKL